MACSAVLALAISVVDIHLATNLFAPYGVHRDEFLYLAMGRHLDLFRMEFPPAIAILALISMLLGDSLDCSRESGASSGTQAASNSTLRETTGLLRRYAARNAIPREGRSAPFAKLPRFSRSPPSLQSKSQCT